MAKDTPWFQVSSFTDAALLSAALRLLRLSGMLQSIPMAVFSGIFYYRGLSGRPLSPPFKWVVAKPVALTTWVLGGQLQLVGALTLVSQSGLLPAVLSFLRG